LAIATVIKAKEYTNKNYEIMKYKMICNSITYSILTSHFGDNFPT
jgi:hypothetical protein